MAEPSHYLVSLCRTHLLSGDGGYEDVLGEMLLERAEEEGVDLGDLQDQQSDALRAEGKLPSA